MKMCNLVMSKLGTISVVLMEIVVRMKMEIMKIDHRLRCFSVPILDIESALLLNLAFDGSND